MFIDLNFNCYFFFIVTAFKEFTFQKKSLQVSFHNTSVELLPPISSKSIACALQCTYDSNCLAYVIDHTSMCTLETTPVVGLSSTGQNVVQKIIGKQNCSKSCIELKAHSSLTLMLFREVFSLVSHNLKTNFTA